MNSRVAFFATLAVVAATAAHAQGKPPVVDTTPKLAFGQMMKSGDKLVFAPCRDRSYATFEDVSNGQQVTKALSQVGLDTGNKLYVEVLGVLENSFLKASEINMVRAEGRCQLPVGRRKSGARRVTNRAGHWWRVRLTRW
jgi:putative lipoprotein